VLHFLGSTYILIVIAAIVVAATALAYYSYEYAREMAERGEQRVVLATRDVAQQRRARIDNLILDSNEILFNLVDVENLRDFPRRWSDIGRLSPTVESVIVLDEKLQFAPDGFASKKRSKADVDAFRKLFESVIIHDLGLRDLEPGKETQLHKRYEGRYYLLSTTRRDVAGKRFYIVIEVDLAHLVVDIFPEVFEGDAAHRMVQIVDERGNLVFGHAFSGVPSKYLVSLVPRTLWSWRLRMAPRDVPTLVAEEAARRTTDWLFIGLSSITLFVGVGLLTYAVRTERRANQAKSDFIANVSHELKTPLSLIRMFGEILASGRTTGPDKAREYAEIITRESERLSRLIDNVLDFARAERGKIAYDMRVGDLAEVISRALDVYRHRLEREGMALDVAIAGDVPPVRMDEGAMTLVLLNLVDNAVKYAADGKRLLVTLRRDPADAGRVLLEVSDSGPGIERGERERIFERFYRARRVRGQPVRGSGIGLAIVKHICVAHGGDVTVDAAPGGGSTFTVWLPVVAPDEAPAHERHVEAAGHEGARA
jgi:two-component system phosphate regulon sensor histidine kinase PhoR